MNKDIYETVCSFNNRNGGYIFLGIIDGTREIRGVNPDKVDSMMKDFTTTVNNPNRINPPMYLSPKDIEIDGKKIIYIRVPEGTQVRRLNGRIMDRTYEGDIDITDNAELVYKMYARKQSTYFVNKVYPNLGMEHLDFDVIQRAKKMAVSRVENHAWTNMSEEEILRSTGLILTDPDTGKEGITLAAILLFGKDSSIMSVLPQYKTDAIFRVKNLDRYDDREVIITNLIDSYRKLMDFGKKHLNDVFVLDGDLSVSARDKILREIVSNILSHRDYANAYTAQFVIERDVMYTKLYSGGTPTFIEDNIFEIRIPIANVAGLQVGPEETEKVPIKSADKKVPITGMSKKYQSKTLQNFSDIEKYLKENGETSTSVLCEALGIKERRMRDILSDMEQEGIIVGTGEKRDRRYGIREK